MEEEKKEQKNTNKQKTKNDNFIEAWENAFNGIIYAVTTQGNIKKQLLIAVFVMIISLFFNLNTAEFLCLMFTVILILIAEMINTAIETVVDLYTDLYHPKAKIAKDVGAGAVVIAAINALIVAYFLFFDKIADIGLNFIRNIAESPVHLAFLGVFITIIFIVALKAASVTDKHKWIKKGFTVSGQAGIAFAANTMIWISTDNIVILTLSLVMAILVAESRIETKKRSLKEVIAGGIAGTAIVLLIYGLAGTFLKVF